MKRALQRPDGPDDRRVHIGQCGRRDAGGECGRVQLVIRVQNQRDVKGAHGQFGRPLARQHVQKVRSVPERRMRVHRRTAARHPAPRRDECRHLCRQADRPALVRQNRSIASVWIVVSQQRGQGAQRIHAVAFRQRAHCPHDGIRQFARGDECRLQIAELAAVRQPAVPQKKAHFFERRATFRIRQIVNVVSLIREHAAGAVQKTDRGLSGHDVFEAGFGFHVSRHGICRSSPRSHGPMGRMAPSRITCLRQSEGPFRAGRRCRSAGRWTAGPCRGTRTGRASETAACHRCHAAGRKTR
jgi:hypothetical protein